MTTKRLFIPMTKYDAVKGIAYGVAASSTLDRAGEIFDYAGSKPYFEKWSANAVKATAGKSAGNLRSMHGAIAAGLIQSINFNDDDELIEVAAKVVDANEQKKCEEGVYTGFSMGGKYVKKWKDGDAQRYIADPYEISLVDLPCIPDATFEYVKGAQTELRKFHVEPAGEAPKEPTNDEVVAKAHALAAEAKTPDAWVDMIGEARKALAAPATFSNDLEPKHVLEIAVTAVDETVEKGAGDELGAVQQWTHPRLPGEGFEKKADLRAALADLDATETAAKLAAPVTDAIKSLTAVLDERDPAGVKKDSSDNPDFGGKDAKDKGKKADPKATADAKAKQKAKDEADKSKPMKSAVDVIARAKEWMANPVPAFVERREIIKAAAEHNATAALPDGFIEEPNDRLEKIATPELAKQATLYSVSSLISVLASLDSLEANLSGDSPAYDYYSSGTTRIDVSPETLTSIRSAMKTFGDVCATLLDEVLAGMVAEDAEKAVARGTVLGGLFKIGARNSKADQNRLAKAHDLLAEINPSMCGGGAEKDAGDGDLTKVLKAQEAAFSKTLEGIGDVIKDVAERVKRIEEQPVGGRPTSVNVVEKGSVLETVLANQDPAQKNANHEAFIAMQGEFARFAAPVQR